MNTIVAEAAPFTAEQTAQFLADFHRDGFLHVPEVLTAEEVAALREGVDRVMDDPQSADTGNLFNEFIALRLFETTDVFRSLLRREPIISLMESLLGSNCHLIAQNAMRNAPGNAIDMFHVDEDVLFPVAEGMERHDARLTMPVMMINVMFPLTSIPSVEFGPTQCVPGSHYAGRTPNDLQEPSFEGRGPVSLLVEPGDMYMFNTQVWHRGAPNTSTQTRYVTGMAFGRRCMAQRFHPYINYQMPPQVLENADDRTRRLLGLHAQGAWG